MDQVATASTTSTIEGARALRIFTREERAALTRKACELREAALVPVTVERLEELLEASPVLEFDGDLGELGQAIAARRALAPNVVEFVALELHSGAAFLVNTEGYDYARYLGRAATPSVVKRTGAYGGSPDAPRR